MTDRAVVGGFCCENPDIQMYYGDDDQQHFYCHNCNSPFPPVQPQPRAVVAVSEDRQWLVVLEDIGAWCLRRRDYDDIYVIHYLGPGSPWLHDTGQDAHEVLREFLEGRDA